MGPHVSFEARDMMLVLVADFTTRGTPSPALCLSAITTVVVSPLWTQTRLPRRLQTIQVTLPLMVLADQEITVRAVIWRCSSEALELRGLSRSSKVPDRWLYVIHVLQPIALAFFYCPTKKCSIRCN